MKKKSSIEELLKIMTRLRSPDGCPWDREQDHKSLRFHAVEEVCELMDAIESEDDEAMVEELGDLLLQVVFHGQLGKERRAFDFEQIARHIADKLVRRHPHVFGTTRVRNVDQVWANWEKIKHAEKEGTRHARSSVFDGIPRHLPALLRAEKLVKKARKAGLVPNRSDSLKRKKRNQIAEELFTLAEYCLERGWSAEELLRSESKKQERLMRAIERRLDAPVSTSRGKGNRRRPKQSSAAVPPGKPV